MRNDKDNLIVNLSFNFALKIIEFAEILEINKQFVIAKQLLKSGTSVGANIKEAQNAESKLDFIHKLKIASKELDEAEYWLELCKSAKNYPFDENLFNSSQDLKRILSKIISTSKKNIKSDKLN